MGESLNLALALEGRAKAAPENAQLVAIAERLADLPDPQIDPTFMLALEQRILNEDLGAQQQQERRLEAVPAAPSPAHRPEPVRRAPVVQMPKRRFVIRRSVAALAAAASLAAFPFAAAASSLPGSPFHGLKTFMERTQLALFGTPIEDGFTHLRLFDVRMAEVEQLTALGADAGLIEASIDAMEYHLLTAKSLVLGNTSDPATLRSLGAMARAAETRLRAVAPTVGPLAGPHLDGAIVTTIDIQRAVDDALGITQVAPAIESVSRATVATTGTSSSRSAGTEKSSTTHQDRSGGDRGDDDDRIQGHDISDVAEGCQVPGSADGLGDVLAPVAKIMCSG